MNDLPPVGSSIYLVGAGVTVTGQDTICDGDQVRLNGTSATSYAWDVNDPSNVVTDNVAFTPTINNNICSRRNG